MHEYVQIIERKAFRCEMRNQLLNSPIDVFFTLQFYKMSLYTGRDTEG